MNCCNKNACLCPFELICTRIGNNCKDTFAMNIFQNIKRNYKYAVFRSYKRKTAVKESKSILCF